MGFGLKRMADRMGAVANVGDLNDSTQPRQQIIGRTQQNQQPQKLTLTKDELNTGVKKFATNMAISANDAEPEERRTAARQGMMQQIEPLIAMSRGR